MKKRILSSVTALMLCAASLPPVAVYAEDSCRNTSTINGLYKNHIVEFNVDTIYDPASKTATLNISLPEASKNLVKELKKEPFELQKPIMFNGNYYDYAFVTTESKLASEDCIFIGTFNMESSYIYEVEKAAEGKVQEVYINNAKVTGMHKITNETGSDTIVLPKLNEIKLADLTPHSASSYFWGTSVDMILPVDEIEDSYTIVIQNAENFFLNNLNFDCNTKKLTVEDSVVAHTTNPWGRALESDGKLYSGAESYIVAGCPIYDKETDSFIEAVPYASEILEKKREAANDALVALQESDLAKSWDEGSVEDVIKNAETLSKRKTEILANNGYYIYSPFYTMNCIDAISKKNISDHQSAPTDSESAELLFSQSYTYKPIDETGIKENKEKAVSYEVDVTSNGHMIISFIVPKNEFGTIANIKFLNHCDENGVFDEDMPGKSFYFNPEKYFGEELSSYSKKIKAFEIPDYKTAYYGNEYYDWMDKLFKIDSSYSMAVENLEEEKPWLNQSSFNYYNAVSFDPSAKDANSQFDRSTYLADGNSYRITTVYDLEGVHSTALLVGQDILYFNADKDGKVVVTQNNYVKNPKGEYEKDFCAYLKDRNILAKSTMDPETAFGSVGYVFGDANGDCNLNIMDVIKMNKFILGSSTVEERYRPLADINGDGTLDSSDCLDILKRVVDVYSDSDVFLLRRNNMK